MPTDRQRRAWARHREVGCPADGENIACWGPTLADYAWVDAHPSESGEPNDG